MTRNIERHGRFPGAAYSFLRCDFSPRGRSFWTVQCADRFRVALAHGARKSLVGRRIRRGSREGGLARVSLGGVRASSIFLSLYGGGVVSKASTFLDGVRS